MNRCVALWWITGYLFEVAVAMLDGSYWREDTTQPAQPSARAENPHFWD